MDALLRQNPSWKLLSKTKLFAAAKAKDPSLKRAALDEWYKANGSVTNEFFARPRARGKQAKIASPPYSFQIDVVQLPAYRSANAGVSKFLLIVEINSRKAWAYPLKDETMPTILASYKRWLDALKDEPWKIEGDDAFAAKAFQDFNRKRNVPVKTGVAADEHITKGNPLGIIDSLVWTLKSLIEKRIRAEDDAKWTKWLDEVLKLYNETPHDGLKEGKAPNDVYGDLIEMHKRWVAASEHNREVAQQVAEKFKKGDFVRVRLRKATFEKGTTQTMSDEVYRVVSSGLRVTLETWPGGESVPRQYKPNELAKVDKPVNVPAAGRTSTVRKTSAAATKLTKDGLTEAAAKVAKGAKPKDAPKTRGQAAAAKRATRSTATKTETKPATRAAKTKKA